MSKANSNQAAERHEETQPVFMMGGGGLVIERVDEQEKRLSYDKPAVDEKPPLVDEPVADEKLMRSRTTDDTSLPASETEPKRKPTRKLTLPAASKWSQDKSIWLFKSFWVLIVSMLGYERSVRCTDFHHFSGLHFAYRVPW